MSQENVESVRRAYEHWNQGDFGWTDDFAPGFEYVPAPVVGLSDTARGLDGFMRFLEEFWEDLDEAQAEPQELIEAGDSVLAVITFRGIGRHSGVEVNMEVFQLWTFRDGKLVRGQGFFERAEALEAAGLAE